MWHISSQWPETCRNICIQSKTQSAQCVINGSNILRLIEQKFSMSLELLLKGRAEPMRGTRLSMRLIESRHCVVCSMGLRRHVKALEISIENLWYLSYHRYKNLSKIGQILVFQIYLCSSIRYKNFIKIKINISLLYACIFVQCINETNGRTETHRNRHNSSIPYVNGGTLLFSASSNNL